MLESFAHKSKASILITIEEPAPSALLSFFKVQRPISAAVQDDGPPRKRRKTDECDAGGQINAVPAREYLTLARADVEIVRSHDFQIVEGSLIVLLGLF